MNTHPQLPLPPLPYHVGVADYLQRREAEIWKWCSTDRLRAEQSESVRLDLLKATYRMERETGPALYAAADEVAGRLGLDAPVTLYQSQSNSGLNASLAYVSGEVHVVLRGPVTDRLTPVELRCVLGHELAHYVGGNVNDAASWTCGSRDRSLLRVGRNGRQAGLRGGGDDDERDDDR
jgi:Peptidase family M48